MIIEAYRGHGIWGIIENVQNHLDSFSEEAKVDPRYKEFCEKLDYTKWLLETSNYAFFSANEMQNISQHMNSISQHLPNNANNWSQYEQVSNGFEAVFAILPYPRIKKIFRSEANDAIEEFTNKVSTIKTEMLETGEATEAKIDEELTKLMSFVGDEKTRVESFIEVAKSEQSALQQKLAEIQGVVSGLETTTQTQFDVWEANNTSQITDKLSELSKVFSEAQASRSEEYQNQKNAASSALANLNDSIKTVQKKQYRTSEACEGGADANAK